MNITKEFQKAAVIPHITEATKALEVQNVTDTNFLKIAEARFGEPSTPDQGFNQEFTSSL